ncbi:MAG: aminopeptidase [Candidatus Baldrarchaeia archaeon]
MRADEAAKNALLEVLEATSGERILIIADEEKADIAEVFSRAAISIGMWTRLLVLKEPESPRKSVPDFLREIIISNRPTIDVFVNVLRGIIEEVPFRIELIELERRGNTRLAHCPGITMNMLTEGAMALTREEYREMKTLAHKLILLLEDAAEIRVTNSSGTDISFSVMGRPFFTDVEISKRFMNWVNLPVGEVLVAPVENSMNGCIVADAAGGIGPLKDPAKLTVKDGKVISVECADPDASKRISNALNIDATANVTGEFAIGLNKRARIVKEFLETEKVHGTVHIAFGNNEDFPGGRNRSKGHIDFLITEPTVVVRYKDGHETEIMKNGSLLL